MEALIASPLAAHYSQMFGDHLMIEAIEPNIARCACVSCNSCNLLARAEEVNSATGKTGAKTRFLVRSHWAYQLKLRLPDEDLFLSGWCLFLKHHDCLSGYSLFYFYSILMS